MEAIEKYLFVRYERDVDCGETCLVGRKRSVARVLDVHGEAFAVDNAWATPSGPYYAACAKGHEIELVVYRDMQPFFAGKNFEKHRRCRDVLIRPSGVRRV